MVAEHTPIILYSYYLVLELAVESRADFLLTFKARDFAGAERFGIRVIPPREFLAIVGEAR